MKYMKISLLLAVMAVALASCKNDTPSCETIFKPTQQEMSEFDKWLQRNYLNPYNIQFNYLYNDKLSNNNYNVVPAGIDNSKAMAIMIKHVWLDAYKEVCGEDFVKKNGFRVFQLIGSPEYDGQNKIVLGTAEDGMQVTLFRVNELDLDHIYVNMDEPYRSHYDLPLDLNYWYFHTMHHEFCHILTQKKDYTTDFQAISAGKYHSSDWVNVDDQDAPSEGFVTYYASGEYNEDFAEVYSCYVTSTEEAWQAVLDKGVKYTVSGADTKGNPLVETYWGEPTDSDLSGSGFKTISKVETDETSKNILISKLDIVRTYFNDSWGVDIDKLREVVLRRSTEVMNMDLQTLR